MTRVWLELAAVKVNHGYCACTWRGVRPRSGSQGSHAEQGTVAFTSRDTASALCCGVRSALAAWLLTNYASRD